MQDEEVDKPSSVDFGSAGLYLGGIQTIAGVLVSATVSVLSCWMLPDSVVSAVRTLVATSFFGFLVVRKAVRIGRVRGVSMLFSALRPCVFIYILALVLEELSNANCKPGYEDTHTTAKRVVYHVSTIVMIVCAFARAQSPRSESDWPFAVVVFCLAVVAILPIPSASTSGPLSQPPKTLMDAGERLMRATLFSFVYSMHVYASAPTRNIGSELLVCVGRATAASVWVLCVSPMLLIAMPFQSVLCVMMSLNSNANGHGHGHEYESIPLKSNHGSANGGDGGGGGSVSGNMSGSDAGTEIASLRRPAENGDGMHHPHSIEQRGFGDLRASSLHKKPPATQLSNLRMLNSLEYETEDASLSCSSDIESESGLRRYGQPVDVHSQSVVPSSRAPTSAPGMPPISGFSFQFGTSLAPVSTSNATHDSNLNEVQVAAAIARESNV